MLSDTMMLGGGRKAAYSIENSLLFRGAQYLSRTPGVVGNRQVWTYSSWHRVANLTTNQYLFSAGSPVMGGTLTGVAYYGSMTNGGFALWWNSASTGAFPAPVFRDPSGYYHIVLTADGTKLVLHVNGHYVGEKQITGPGEVNNTSAHHIGSALDNTCYFDGYMAEIAFIDGQALPPTTFGELDLVTGSWRPKKLANINYGANGFYLGKPWDANDLGADNSSGAYSHNLRLIGANTGTLTMGGGVNAAFDGIETKVGADCAALWLPSSWIGHVQKQWPSAKTIIGYEVFGPTNHDMCGSAGNTVTLSLLGSNTGAFAGEEVILHADTFTSNTGDQRRYFSGVDVSSPYLYHRVLKSSASGNTYFAQVKLYENGSYGRNTWTATGFTATDVVADTPTDVYCTLNPLDKATVSGVTVDDGGLHVGMTTNGPAATVASTFSVSSGKWYWEIPVTDGQPRSGFNVSHGVVAALAVRNGWVGCDAFGWGWRSDQKKANNGTLTTYGIKYGDSVDGNGNLMVALDMDAGAIWFGKDGAWQGGATLSEIQSGDTSRAAFTGIGGPVCPAASTVNLHCGMIYNFGQSPFAHTPPAGFKALCTANLPAPASPAVKEPWKYYACKTFTTTGNVGSFSVDWNPDPANGGSHTLFRIKRIDDVSNWWWIDTVRGLDKVLSSDSVAAENTLTVISSVSSDGTVNVSLATGYTYLVEGWRVAPEAGFDIVLHNTSVASSQTVAHGCGSVPKFFVGKIRNAADGWYAYHASLGAGSYLKLNTADAATVYADMWNNTSPTTTDITLGRSWSNASSQCVFYAWSEVPGFSAFGSYTGTGSADGPFVHLGFAPAEFTGKRVDGSSAWGVQCLAMDETNPVQAQVYLNQSNARDTSNDVDFLSNGVKLRNSTSWNNFNGGNYITAAWAAHPLGARRITPATAR